MKITIDTRSAKYFTSEGKLSISSYDKDIVHFSYSKDAVRSDQIPPTIDFAVFKEDLLPFLKALF